MPWFKVDDKLHDHRKARKARKAAMGVWVLAGSWSMDNRTDGFIPESVLSRWGTKHDAATLVGSGLWFPDHKDDEDGWQFHAWLEFQPDAKSMQLKAEAESAGGAIGNHRRWHSKRKVIDPDCEFCHHTPDWVPDQDPDDRPESVPDSPPNPPVPVPIPHYEPNGSARSTESPTQAFVAEWIEHCSERPPSRVIGQVSKEVKALIEDGIEPPRIRAGLAEWHRKSLHPSTLASVVHETTQRAAMTVEPESWMRRRPKA